MPILSSLFQSQKITTMQDSYVIRFKLSSPTEQDYLERMNLKSYYFNDIDRAFRFPNEQTAQAVLESMNFSLKEHLVVTKLDSNE